MTNIFSKLLLVLALLPAALRAQTFPAVPAAPAASLQDQALRDWLRTNWYDGKRVVLSYSAARAKMYNYADNYNNTVTCVYSGFSTPRPLDFNNSSTTIASINCEHSIPQSWFNEAERMRTDMHHLYPTFIQWNSNRGSDPFAELPDATTTLWMRGSSSQTTIPTANIDEYSEDTNSAFEPREDHKGNLARTAFYFYTMHDTQPELIADGKQNITSLAPLATLYAWHLADPVDAREIERNRRVAASQGNYNPYIEHPELVARAYSLAAPGPTFSFATGTGTIVEGNSGTSTYTATLSLSVAATTATTVQVTLSSNSTATNGTDFTFATPTTVTFPAGSTSQTVTLTVAGDTQPEADETVVLSLANASTGNSVGSPASHTLTIGNDDGAAPAVAFATAAGTIVEGNSGTSTYTVNVTASGTIPAGSFTVPVTVDAAGTTATSPADYTLNTPTLTFSATSLTQPVTITVVGDAGYEPGENVRLLLGLPSDGTVLLPAPNAHVLTISNDDAAPAPAPCTKPYFSQYVESGTGSNTKVVEIYNPTASPLALNGKRLVLYSNGASTPTTTQALSGIIAPYDVYVVANTDVTDPTVEAQTDQESAVAFFNGDDAIALFDGTDTLDVIGVIGQRPTAWNVPGGGSTLNNTLVRLPATNQGGRWNGPFGAATWVAQGTNNFADVGSHTSTACRVATASRPAAVLRNALEIFPNPATETVQVRLPGLASARATTVQVLDLLGRPVRQRTAQLGGSETVALDLRGLPAGLYAVRVQSADAEYTGRVVVQ